MMRDIRLWKDKWVPNCGPLHVLSVGNVTEMNLNLPVSHFVQLNGEWNLSLFENNLPEHLCQLVSSLPPPYILHEDDNFTWGATPDGSFTTSSAYKTLSGWNNQHSNPIFKIIWNWKGPERIRTFLWKLAHEAILTNMERARRHMTHPLPCFVCGTDDDEALLH